jgi:RraA family protein
MPDSDVAPSVQSTAPKPPTKPTFAEMHLGPGFRIRYDIDRPDPELLAGYRLFDSPDVSDLMNRLYTMCCAIGPVTTQAASVVGPACTVKVFPGDNLMVHKALDVAKPGDVLVVDAGSSLNNAVLGDLISTKARHRGIAGIVVDGLIRDLPGIEALGDFPVFARGVTPIGPLQRGPGEINMPVSVGGIVVHPGDLIVADLNGVVVVPLEATDDVLQRLVARSLRAGEYLAAVAKGTFSNAWIDAILLAAGLPADAVRSWMPETSDA